MNALKHTMNTFIMRHRCGPRGKRAPLRVVWQCTHAKLIATGQRGHQEKTDGRERALMNERDRTQACSAGPSAD